MPSAASNTHQSSVKRSVAAAVFATVATLIGSPAPPCSAQGVVPSRFGTMPDGVPVMQYSLRNRAGSQANVISLGATLQSLRLHDRAGRMIDVVLGYDSPAEYLSGKAYFGASIGRYANRIAHAEFSLDDKIYHLPANNGPNTLHGGTIGFNRVLWNRVASSRARNAVRLSYVSPDGDQGFPGKLSVAITYTLTDSNELRISYEARTSAATVINLTNHTYFNLGGAGSGDVSRERIAIRASAFTPVDTAGLPTGEIKAVDGTDFDFRAPKSLGEHRQSASDPAVIKSDGYDVNLVLDGGAHLRKVAALQDRETGLAMEVSTTEPGLQLFTPSFPSGRLIGKSGRDYGGHAAVCLETQHFPDSPHFPSFPTTVLRPGQTFHSETIYRFSTAPGD